MYTITFNVIGETRQEAEAALRTACDDIFRSPHPPDPLVKLGKLGVGALLVDDD